MDGERKECPIVDNEAIRINLTDENYILVSATHDTIQMFPNGDYNYLRYYDPEDGQMKAFWFDAEILADLYDAGIPPTKRESITTAEYQLYQHYMGKLSMQDVVDVEEAPEPLELMPGDPIDAAVQQAHEHFDAELDYYLKEWGIDGAA